MNEKPKPGWREGREIEDEENGKQWNMEANQEEATLGQNSILFHRVGSIMLEFCIQKSHNFDCKIAMTAVMVTFRTKLSVIQERYVNVQIKWKDYFYRHLIGNAALAKLFLVDRYPHQRERRDLIHLLREEVTNPESRHATMRFLLKQIESTWSNFRYLTAPTFFADNSFMQAFTPSYLKKQQVPTRSFSAVSMARANIFCIFCLCSMFYTL